MLRMAVRPGAFRPTASNHGVQRLRMQSLPDVERLYADGASDGTSPDYFFPSMLDEGVFFGVRANGELVSIAGTHVLALEEGVAAMGNVYTRRDCRGHSRGRVLGIPSALPVPRRGGREKEEPMSYDLHLFRLPPGADPREVFARHLEAEEQDVLDGDAAHRTVQDDSARAAMERLAGLLTARHPAFERFHQQRPLPWIEFNDGARQ